MIHPTAIVDPTARIGKGTKVWSFVQVAEHVKIGRNCILGNGVYIDRYVQIGNEVWIQNKALLYQGILIKDQVFIGPGVCFTNDRWPQVGAKRNMRAKLWVVGEGATIGANATILPDISIGTYALVGAGSVVTKNVPDHALVWGNPARFKGWVCRCRKVFDLKHLAESARERSSFRCKHCKDMIRLPDINSNEF